MDIRKLSEICGYIGTDAGYEADICEITTDSRKAGPGMLFIPIRGARFDGHDFIGDALAAGAAAVLSGRESNDARVIHIGDTAAALRDIAEGYRKGFDIYVCAVTGSVGKTTTKDITAHVLSKRFNTHKTEGNFNNEIGLPMSVLGLSKKHNAAVFELGMSAFGEISRLVKIVKPKAAVITNIGTSHIEFLGSREGICKAKMEITEGIQEGGVLILNGDEELLWNKRNSVGVKTITFGINNKKCDITADIIESGEDSVIFRASFSDRTIRLASAGIHSIYNAMTAAAVGMNAGMTPGEIIEGLESYCSDNSLRQNIYEINGIRIIKDCYNSSPESLGAALEVLKAQKIKGKRIAVLGTMRELGSYSPEAHIMLGKKASEICDYIITYGEEASNYVLGAGNKAVIASDHKEIAELLSKKARSGDTILFKGSRLMKLENAVKIYEETINKQ